VPAVVHEDGTSRIQAVRREANPRFHRLISAFQRRTGVPMVLNTSFNDSEPIVCSPRDAIGTFLKTEIDYLVLEDFVVGKAENRDAVERWRRKNAPGLHARLDRLLRRFEVTPIDRLHIVTDRFTDGGPGRVPPLFPEHRFFLDEMPRDRFRGAAVLDLESGPGALAIAAAQAGARRVVALERSPRARAFAGFNILLNGWAGTVEVQGGDDEVYRPVHGQVFDAVIANLCAAGAAMLYGMGLVEKVLCGLDEHLSERGCAQLVLIAPGDSRSPFMLVDLVSRHWRGRAVLRVNSDAAEFDRAVEGLALARLVSPRQAAARKLEARAGGVTHLHLCVAHLEKGPRAVQVEVSPVVYRDWHLPLSGIRQG
jgi:hypothetical protein